MQVTRTSGGENVFIITNRKARSRSGSSFRFSEKRGAELSYGCMNNGVAKLPNLSKSTECTKSEEEFYLELTQASKANPARIIVFVHGYNCNVKVPYGIASELARQTQIPVVVFSWPSKRNPLTYTSDECNAEWSSFQLAQILDELEKRYGNASITLIGHSMGCRLICWALQHNRTFESSAGSKYDHILFCAPDMDSQIFEKNIPRLQECTDDTRVFASTKDIRLFFSKVLHGNSRLGLLSRHFRSNEENDGGETAVKPVKAVTLIDYTGDDRTIFGHAMPYELIRRVVSAK